MNIQTTRDAPQTVATLRDEIDRIDDALLDLVEARVAKTRAMAALKDTDATSSLERRRRLKLRPRREIEVMARMTARARLAQPAMVEHLWRTLMAYGLQDQATMRLVLYADPAVDRLAFHEAVRIRFGPAAALAWASTTREALNAARNTETVAVVAAVEPPSLDLSNSGETVLRLFETLPLGNYAAYAIGRIALEDMPREAVR